MEINQVDNLVDALKSFTKVEQVGDSKEKLTCEHCKAKVYKNKQLTLDKAPDVLAFQLKRFTTIDNCIEKIEKLVSYPLELDLKPFHRNPDTVVSSVLLYQVPVVSSCSRNFRLMILSLLPCIPVLPVTHFDALILPHAGGAEI